MKQLHKIVAALMIMLLVLSPTVYGEENLQELIDQYLSDAINMDRVYAYDFIEKKAEATETVKDRAAINTVMALGIMNNLTEDTFGEDKFVTYTEFAEIILKLTVGEVDDIKEKYKAYSSTKYATQHDAAYYLVGAIGYDIYERKYGGDNPRTAVAEWAGLLKGINFAGDKNITRGEFARMIYNALQKDMIIQTTFGKNAEFSLSEGKNLLGEKFNAVLIEDIVTAQDGVNLYSSAEIKKSTIEIGRVPYYTNKISVPDLLGYRVSAIAVDNGEQYFSLISLELSDKDETLELDLKDVYEINDSKILYTIGNQDKKGSISALKYIMYNGKQETKERLKDLAGAEGRLRLCCSQRDGIYDIAIVSAMNSYTVKDFSVLNEKVFLKHGMLYNGSSYIDVSDDDKVMLRLDGVKSDINSLKAGQVISVMKSGENLILELSTKKVTGLISEVSGKNVVIDGKTYQISDAYEQAQKTDKLLPKLEVGLGGIFYLNYQNRIVDYVSDSSSDQYGYLLKIGYNGGGIDKNVMLRVYTDDGEWETFELADTLEFDGVEKTPKETAYQKMNASREDVENAIIRYKINKDEKVVFLDTARVKSPEEKHDDTEVYDKKAVRKDATWNGKLNWTITYDYACLTSSKYMIINSAMVFVVPEDTSDEGLYRVMPSKLLVPESKVEMDLYNIDDFHVVGMAVVRGDIIADSGNSRMIVKQLTKAVDKNGDEVCGIKGYMRNKQTDEWDLYSFVTNRAIDKKTRELCAGDIITFSPSGNTINSFEVDIAAKDFDTDYIVNWNYSDMKCVGTVVDVDAERNLMTIEVNGQKQTCYARFNCLYLKDTNRAYKASYGDICAGDRVYAVGEFGWVVTFIVR